MKSLFLAAALAVLTSTSQAGAAAPETLSKADATVAVIADAGRLSSAGLATMHDGAPWAATGHAAPDDFDTLSAQFEPGQWLVALCVLAVALSRPVARLLRRHEKQRRAAALASTLDRR